MFRKNIIKNLAALCLCFILICCFANPIEGTKAYVSYKSETCVNTFTGEDVTEETPPSGEEEPDDINRNTSPVSPSTGSADSVKFATAAAGGALAAVIFLTVKKKKGQ